MTRFVLETVIAASPADVFALSLDPELHLRSMARHRETMVEAPEGGVFTEGSTVTWQARHLGIPFRLRSIVFDIDPPHGFSDRQISGPFASFLHMHAFAAHPRGTLMRDTVAFRSPFGPLGALVDRLFLGAYMRRLIEERNTAIVSAFESPGRTLSP